MAYTRSVACMNGLLQPLPHVVQNSAYYTLIQLLISIRDNSGYTQRYTDKKVFDVNTYNLEFVFDSEII